LHCKMPSNEELGVEIGARFDRPSILKTAWLP
jgi:hypothetical protein